MERKPPMWQKVCYSSGGNIHRASSNNNSNLGSNLGPFLCHSAPPWSGAPLGRLSTSHDLLLVDNRLGRSNTQFAHKGAQRCPKSHPFGPRKLLDYSGHCPWGAKAPNETATSCGSERPGISPSLQHSTGNSSIHSQSKFAPYSFIFLFLFSVNCCLCP